MSSPSYCEPWLVFLIHNTISIYTSSYRFQLFIFRPVPSSMSSVLSQVDKVDTTEMEVVTDSDELQVNKADSTEVNVVSLYS